MNTISAPLLVSTDEAGLNAQPDDLLIAAVRCDPPSPEALDALAARYGRELAGRCRSMTFNSNRSDDLAQAAWCRVLRARQSLKPEGNFPAYLTTIATNLWRDSLRSAQRAGAFADHRLASLDAEMVNDDGESCALMDLVPDAHGLHIEDRALLRMDIDQALRQLPLLLQDVLVARFILGESCAEIGQRYQRTEQTVSGWVREGIRQMRGYLQEPAEEAEAEAA